MSKREGFRRYNLSIALFLILTACHSDPKKDHDLFLSKLDAPSSLLSADSTAMFYCPMTADSVKWRTLLFSPSCYETEGSMFVFFSAKESHDPNAGICRIGLAIRDKDSGLQILDQPLIFPDANTSDKYEDASGCYEPRVTAKVKGEYYMTYNTRHRGARNIAIAKSKDLRHWVKLGNITSDASGSSAVILQKQTQSGKMALMTAGHFHMFWGDKVVRIKRSKDLVNWEPVLTPSGAQHIIFGPRADFFDQEWVSPVSAIWTKSGIKVFYNGGTRSEATVGIGQMMLSEDPPFAVISRSSNGIEFNGREALDKHHYSIQDICKPQGIPSVLLSSDQGGVLYAEIGIH